MFAILIALGAAQAGKLLDAPFTGSLCSAWNDSAMPTRLGRDGSGQGFFFLWSSLATYPSTFSLARTPPRRVFAIDVHPALIPTANPMSHPPRKTSTVSILYPSGGLSYS